MDAKRKLRQKTSFALFAGRSFSSLICVDSWLIPLRRERGDDLFKARIAAERIPKRQELQLAITEPTWVGDGCSKLFAGQILVADPGRHDGQKFNHMRTVNCICFHRKKQLTVRI